MSVSTQPGQDKAKQAWQSAERVAAYRQSRDPARYGNYEREERIVNAWLDTLRSGAVVLDVPCGTGRMVRTVTRRGLRYVGADFSLAMIQEARTAARDKTLIGFANADAASLPFRGNGADCVIVWRLLHHIFDADTRMRILREAARVSREMVMVSFHHPISFTAARCWIERKLFGVSRGAGVITQWRLKREATSCGLEVVETKSYRKYVSVNWFALLRKTPQAESSANA